MDLVINKEQYEALGDEQKKLYLGDEAGAEFKVVPEELVKVIASFDGLKSNYDRLLTETKTAKAKLKEFESQQEALRAAAEAKELELQAKKGDFESIKASYEKKIEAAKQENIDKIKELTARLETKVVSEAAQSIVSEIAVAGAGKLLLSYVLPRIRAKYNEDGTTEPEYLDENYKPTAYTRSEFIKIISGDPSCARIIKGSDATGAGHLGSGASPTGTPAAQGAPAAGGKKKMETPEEFKAKQRAKLQELITKNGG